jgi:hypothetical protein
METAGFPLSFKLLDNQYRKVSLAIVAFVILTVAAVTASAQMSVTTLNTPHIQNFDGMGARNLTIADEITGSRIRSCS